MRYVKLPAAGLLAFALAATACAQQPDYEIVVASGTVAKADMAKTVTFVPDESGKPGKQVVLDVAADTVFLEASATTGKDKTAVAAKAVKATDLKVGQKQPVAVVYAKVGDANHLLALAAGDGKLPKGVAVDGVRGVLNKIDGDRAVTMQPLVDGKFGKQQEVAVLAASKFFEMSPKANAKPPYVLKAAKVADLTAKRQAVAVLFVRAGDSPTVLALVAQPGKDDREKKGK